MSIDRLRAFQRRYPEESVSLEKLTWTYRRTRGVGPALLLLPGAQGTGDMFYETALALGDHLDLVTVTYPASLDSEAVADGLALLMGHLAMERANLLGSSLGGYLAQLFAVRHSHRIETLFIANSFCDAGPFQAAMPSASEFTALSAETVMKGLLDKMATAGEPEPAHRCLKDVVQALVGPVQSAETLKARLLAVLTCKPVPPLPLADSRVVLIECDDDPVILPSMRASLRERHLAAEQHTISGGGHYPGILRSQEYAAILAIRLSCAG